MDPADPHDLALRVAAHYRRRLAVTSAAVLVIVLLGLIAVGWGMYVSARDLVPLLADMGEDLGSLARAMLTPGLAGWAAILSAVWVMLIVKEILRWPAWVKLTINLVAGLLAVTLLEVFRHALYTPFFTMLEDLSR